MATPSGSTSPPPKRPKMDEPGPSTITEIPLKAMFVPTRSKGEERRRKRKEKHALPVPYSPGEVLWHDVRDFLGHGYVDEMIARKKEEEWEAPAGLEKGTEVVVRAGDFTVSGESLSLYQPPESDKKWAIITPFAHPGDLVKCRIHKHDRLHSFADLVDILDFDERRRGGEGDRRKDSQKGCQYFGQCGGCQLQPMPYELQLAHKKRTVDLAYKRFSQLPTNTIPEIQDTIPSPKRWGYRTKITPHFDAPPKWLKQAVGRGRGREEEMGVGVLKEEEEGGMNRVDRSKVNGTNGESEVNGAKGVWKVVEESGQGQANGSKCNGDDESVEAKFKERRWDLRIGFERKGKPGVMDIEECPIATPVLNAKMTEERQRIQDTIMSFSRGATLLLRDSLPTPSPASLEPFDPTTPVLPDAAHVAITSHKEQVYERVGDKLFTFTAGAFFQNNNSILVPLTSYVRHAIFPPNVPADKRPTHLVDTYCGSGLFGITLSEGFEKVAGVEIDSQSIQAAKLNAEMNGLEGKTTWLCGKAEDIFGGLPAAGFAGGHSCVVVDPPRKGCDQPFLEQLLAFKPLTVVYVSCNVHTQARDVGWFLKTGEERGVKYVLESLRGFDLFPQTAHVESVAVFRLGE